MRNLALFALLSLVLLAGCDNDYLANELDVTSGAKTRPLAIICEPAEVVPGQDVTVTLRFYEPDPAAMAITWEAVLDYDADLYGEIETENNIVALDQAIAIPAPTFDADGIGEQTFVYTVPANTLVQSSGLDEEFTEPVPDSVRALIQPANADFLTKEEINTFLASADPATLDAEALAWCQMFSDYFAGEIRFRARVESGVSLKITKNLTVRYSDKFASANVNRNEQVRWIGIISIHEPNVDSRDDIELYECDTTYVYHENAALIAADPIPARIDWTYWMFTECTAQPFISPAGNPQDEELDYNWYFLRPSPDATENIFYANDDDGGDTSMELLEELVRIQAPTNAADENLRIFLVARDIRWEWDMYHATPGAVYLEVPVVFEVQE